MNKEQSAQHTVDGKPLCSEPATKAWLEMQNLKRTAINNNDLELAAEWRRVEKIAFPDKYESTQFSAAGSQVSANPDDEFAFIQERLKNMPQETKDRVRKMLDDIEAKEEKDDWISKRDLIKKVRQFKKEYGVNIYVTKMLYLFCDFILPKAPKEAEQNDKM